MSEEFDPFEYNYDKPSGDSFTRAKDYADWKRALPEAKEELDDLLPTVEKEAQFLAKCYVAAKHLGRF